MAGAIKRFQRKTTVSQKGCTEQMILTSEWWMQFLHPVGRYMSMLAWYSDYRHGWIWVWRLLSTEWREVWDQGFRIKLLIHEARVSDPCYAARCFDDLKFSRDSCSRIVYHRFIFMRDGRFCIVTMPWKTFVGLRRFLSWLALTARLDGLHFMWNLREFAQTAFSLQKLLGEVPDFLKLCRDAEDVVGPKCCQRATAYEFDWSEVTIITLGRQCYQVLLNATSLVTTLRAIRPSGCFNEDQQRERPGSLKSAILSSASLDRDDLCIRYPRLSCHQSLRKLLAHF